MSLIYSTRTDISSLCLVGPVKPADLSQNWTDSACLCKVWRSRGKWEGIGRDPVWWGGCGRGIAGHQQVRSQYHTADLFVFESRRCYCVHCLYDFFITWFPLIKMKCHHSASSLAKTIRETVAILNRTGKTYDVSVDFVSRFCRNLSNMRHRGKGQMVWQIWNILAHMLVVGTCNFPEGRTGIGLFLWRANDCVHVRNIHT